MWTLAKYFFSPNNRKQIIHEHQQFSWLPSAGQSVTGCHNGGKLLLSYFTELYIYR